jgi:hypothetical protein
MPLPMWAATAGLSAIQNPEVQNAALNLGGAALRGAGRGADYIARGAGNLAQNVGTGLADRLGALGEQYLPARVNNAGGYARQGLGYLSGGAGGLYNAVFGGNQPQGMNQQGMGGMGGAQGQMGQMTPQEMMQQYYQQQIQQPYQYNYQAEQQRIANDYNRRVRPQLAQQFGGAGLQDSSYFTNALRDSEGDLNYQLAALGERGRNRENELNQARLGQIGQYNLGLQDLGLRHRDLAQRGTIQQRQDALQQLGAMGGFGQQQQANYLNQLYNRLNAQGNLGNLAQGNAFNNIQVQGQVPWWQQLGAGLANAAGQGIAGGIGYGIGGPAGAVGAMRR